MPNLNLAASETFTQHSLILQQESVCTLRVKQSAPITGKLLVFVCDGIGTDLVA